MTKIYAFTRLYLKKGQYSFSLKKKKIRATSCLCRTAEWQMFRLNTKTNENKQTKKLRFLKIARSIFLICHPPLFHNCDLAVAFSPPESCSLLGLWTQAEFLLANTAGKPALRSYKVRRSRLAPHLNIMSGCRKGPAKSDVAPWRAVYWARRQDRGHLD